MKVCSLFMILLKGAPLKLHQSSLDEPKESTCFGGNHRPFEAMAVTKDGATLFCVSTNSRENNRIRVWDIGSDKPKALSPLGSDKNTGYRVVCAAQSMTMVDACGPVEKPIRVWDIGK